MSYARLLLGAVAIAALSTSVWAQGGKYPIVLVPTGQGPYTFPDGFKTDYSKVQILLTEKLAPNLYILHGNAGVDAAHPESSGGRVAVLFGADGVLMVDSENGPVADKMLKTMRSFTNAPIKILINSHGHPDHIGGNAFYAKQGALIIASDNVRNEMMPNPDAPPRPAGSAARSRQPAGRDLCL